MTSGRRRLDYDAALSRDVNAADRADFAVQSVFHTSLMNLVAADAPTEWSTGNQTESALTATTGRFSPEPMSETSERDGKDGRDPEWHPGNLSPR